LLPARKTSGKVGQNEGRRSTLGAIIYFSPLHPAEFGPMGMEAVGAFRRISPFSAFFFLRHLSGMVPPFFALLI